jgi:hypothetical protein
MKTYINSASVLGNTKVQVCSPYITYFGLLRDAEWQPGWEEFEESDISRYFENSMQIFRSALIEFSDVSKTFSSLEEKQLSFMLASLIQARHLIEELERKS